MDEKIVAEIRKLVAKASGLAVDDIQLEVPKDKSMGDYAFPCFTLSKSMKKAPNQIASDVASKIKIGNTIKDVKATGPYLNFFIDPGYLASSVLKDIRQKKERYGSSDRKEDKIMVEYCQVNTHKAFHVGHLRGTLLGSSLIRLLRFSGYDVISANYQGDIGAHVAKSLWYLTKHYEGEYPEENKGIWLGQIYQKANSLLAENPDMYKQELSEILQKLETGDKELTELWKKTRQWSLDDFEIIYNKLGVSFDKYFFESEVDDEGKTLVIKMINSGLAYESEGAIVISLENYGLGVFLLLKSDATALYSTKDLALAKRKFEEFKIDRSLYVVGSEQKFYFQQMFKTLELMGFKQASKCFHLPYDLVTLEGGKISSREGELILALDMLNEVTEYARSEVNKRHDDWSEEDIESAARAIALAGIKFSMISIDNNRQIVFSIEKALDFEGETGPYIQYAHARICSIFKKGENLLFDDADLSLLKEDEEKNIMSLLSGFPGVLADCESHYKVMPLCRYLIDLSQQFNEYYHKHQILKADEDIKKARLYLIHCIRTVLQNGMAILGIEAPEKM